MHITSQKFEYTIVIQFMFIYFDYFLHYGYKLKQNTQNYVANKTCEITLKMLYIFLKVTTLYFDVNFAKP